MPRPLGGVVYCTFFWNAIVLPHPASEARHPLSRVPGEGKIENDLMV